MTDQVPMSIRQVKQRVYFSRELLHTVLAKHAQSCGVCLPDGVCWKSFCDCHQYDVFRIASGSPCGRGHTFPYPCDVIGYRHVKKMQKADMAKQKSVTRISPRAHFYTLISNRLLTRASRLAGAGRARVYSCR